MATRRAAASNRERTAAAKRATNTANTSTRNDPAAGANPDQPSESEQTRVAELSAAGTKNDDVAQLTARQYFGRIGKNLDAPALIGDIVGFLEHLGVIDAPESHAPIE
jgi:hypothetical protein